MKIAIVVYPGSNCDRDVLRILNNVLNVEAKLIWHTDKNIGEFDGKYFQEVSHMVII